MKLIELYPGLRVALSTRGNKVRGVAMFKRGNFRVAVAAEYDVRPTTRILQSAARSVRGLDLEVGGAPGGPGDIDEPLTAGELRYVLGAAEDRARRRARRQERREDRREGRAERRGERRERRGERRERRGERRDERKAKRAARRAAFAERVRDLSIKLAESKVLDKLRRAFNKARKSEVTQALLRAGITAAGGAAGGPQGAMLTNQLAASLFPGQGSQPAPAQTLVHVMGERRSLPPAIGAADIGVSAYGRAVMMGVA